MPRKNAYEFIKKRDVILFIWEYRCYVCQKQSSENHVHHVDNNPWNNTAENLLPLCKQCHKMVHRNLSIDMISFPVKVAHQLWLLDELWKKYSIR